MGFKIEEIVHPDDRKFATQFVCSVCLCIMDEPTQTTCDHIFCEECIAPCLACPTCRTALEAKDRKLLRDCNRPLMRMMHDLKVWCPYHRESKLPLQASAASSSSQHDRSLTELSSSEPETKRARTEPEYCDWMGSYTDLLAKHLGECPHHFVPCPHGCGESLRRKDVADHAPLCQRNYEECSICKEMIKHGTVAAHRKEKAELHAQLLEAKLLEKEGDSVEDSLKDIRRRLGDLESSVKNNAKTQYVKNRSDELKECVNSLAFPQVSTFVWEVKDVKRLKQECYPQSFKDSPEFQLNGLGPFVLRVFPNGDQPATGQPKAGLRLHGPSEVHVAVSLSMGETSHKFDLSSVQVDMGWGMGFPRPPDDKPLIMKVHLNSLAGYAVS